MKRITLLLALLLPITGYAERMIDVRLEWLDHAERQCKGCSTQIFTEFPPGREVVVGEECTGGLVYLKVVPNWKGESVEVALTRQVRKSDGAFIDDGPALLVVVAAGERREVELRGFKYAVSAGAWPGKKPNQSPEPTAMLVTPRADARVAPSTAVAHL